MKLSIYERVLFLAFAAVGFYLCERHGYNNGFNDALSVLSEEELEKIAERVNHQEEEHQDDHLEDHLEDHLRDHLCETCKYQLLDMETGKFECNNESSPAFCNEVEMNGTCTRWESLT